MKIIKYLSLFIPSATLSAVIYFFAPPSLYFLYALPALLFSVAVWSLFDPISRVSLGTVKPKDFVTVTDMSEVDFGKYYRHSLFILLCQFSFVDTFTETLEEFLQLLKSLARLVVNIAIWIPLAILIPWLSPLFAFFLTSLFHRTLKLGLEEYQKTEQALRNGVDPETGRMRYRGLPPTPPEALRVLCKRNSDDTK